MQRHTQFSYFLHKHAFELYLRRGIIIDVPAILREFKDEPDDVGEPQHETPYYVWRTANDGKVRASHAENEGKIFSWDSPPATGHPGEDYGCRCWAEALKIIMVCKN